MIYDINLIPKARKKASGETVFLTVTLSLCCLAAAAYFGVYQPLQNKYNLKEQIQEQEDELASYSDSREYYASLLNQIEAASQTDTALQMITASNLKMTKIMEDLEKSVPKDIIINKMSLTGGLLTIEGAAPSYSDMAQYIVNLRKLENVLKVTFMGAAKGEDTKLQAVNAENNSYAGASRAGKQLHDFAICVSLNSTDVISGLLAQMAAEQAATGEEAAADEAN